MPLSRAEVGRSTPRGRALPSLLTHRVARVAYVGATSAAVDFAVFNLLLTVALDGRATGQVLLANSIAFGCAMVVNYALNARYSFGTPMSPRSAVAYVVFSLTSLLLYNTNLLWLRAVLGADDGLLLNASKVLAMAVLVVWNYLGYRYFVFRSEAPPPKPPQSEPPQSEPPQSEPPRPGAPRHAP